MPRVKTWKKSVRFDDAIHTASTCTHGNRFAALSAVSEMSDIGAGAKNSGKPSGHGENREEAVVKQRSTSGAPQRPASRKTSGHGGNREEAVVKQRGTSGAPQRPARHGKGTGTKEELQTGAGAASAASVSPADRLKAKLNVFSEIR